MNIVDNADAFMAQMRWVIVEFEIMGRPDSRAFQTDRGDFVSNHSIAGSEPGIGALHELGLARLRNGQNNIGLAHQSVPLVPPSCGSKIILGMAGITFNYICDPSQYNSDQTS